MPHDLLELQQVAPDTVAEGDARDAVAGVTPRFIARPRAAADVAKLVAAAGRLGLAVVARGAGTKLDWGIAPERLGLVLDCSQFSRVIEHPEPDFVVRVEPGLLLADLQAQLAKSGQRLPIDEVVPGSTVGGVVATGLCGPLRLRFGSVRDLLIGVGFVRGDGVIAKSGSKVVKNVAGYDLAKLLTGSYGTLGVITEAIFRLRAIPNDELLVVGMLSDEHESALALAAIARLQVAPSALEIYREGDGPLWMGVLLEGAAPVDGRAEEVARVLGPGAMPVERPSWWGRLPGTTTVKAIVPPAAVPELLGAVAAAGHGGWNTPAVTGSATAGALFVGFDAEEPTSLAPQLLALREACAAAGGSAVVLRAPAALREQIDVWGPVPGLELMRRVKSEFDPGRVLSPGRFVGGI